MKRTCLGEFEEVVLLALAAVGKRPMGSLSGNSFSSRPAVASPSVPYTLPYTDWKKKGTYPLN
jgi:hypothetical protein